MSLTSHLKQSQSPILQFFIDHFPGVRILAGRVNRELKNAQTIRPMNKIPYSTIGIAMDYRLRYYFGLTPNEELVAWHGAGLLCGRGVAVSDNTNVAGWIPDKFGIHMFSEDLVGQFFTSLNDVLSRLDPIGKKLGLQEEELIGRYCVVLALFEEAFRAHIQRSPLFNHEYKTVDALLDIVQPNWIEDLSRLSWLFFDQFNELLSAKSVLNPTFDGSTDIGGADADMILDGHIVDIKTTIYPNLNPLWLYQIIGYVLLDYFDKYQICGVGFYLTRQGVFLKWSLRDFLNEVTESKHFPIRDLRHDFQGLLKGLKGRRRF